MGWPNVSIRLELIATSAADLSAMLANFDPAIVPGFSAADWVGFNPIIPGTIYNSFNELETAWFTANVGNTNMVSIFDGGLGTYPPGSDIDWSTPYALGTIQAQIEFQAAASLQTPAEWLAAQDAFYRSLWGLAPVPGSYCFEYNCQNMLITNGVDSEDTMGFEGVAWSFEDPPGTVWDIVAPMAVFFITISADGFAGVPNHAISINQVQGATNKTPYLIERNKK